MVLNQLASLLPMVRVSNTKKMSMSKVKMITSNSAQSNRPRSHQMRTTMTHYSSRKNQKRSISLATKARSKALAHMNTTEKRPKRTNNEI